jgi:predicted NAD/FAD-dependent oxidoreductase
VAKRLASRAARRKRSLRVEQDGKLIQINHEMAEIVARQWKLFRERFGREPGPDDPVFFDPSAAAPQFLSDESADELRKSLLQAAADSGMDPAIVYAMNKTDRIVTEANVQFLTDAELQEWNNAIDEYYQKIKSSATQ